MKRDMYFQILNGHVFNLAMTLFNCSLVSAIKKAVVDFSTARCLDFVCCCLPEFKVNPPQTVTAMSVLLACARACASVPCQSLPPPAGQGRQSVPCLGTERSAHTSHTNWTLWVKRAQALCYGLMFRLVVSGPVSLSLSTFSRH